MLGVRWTPKRGMNSDIVTVYPRGSDETEKFIIFHEVAEGKNIFSDMSGTKISTPMLVCW